MRIAYISYEFLGYRTWGGVATSSMMVAKSFSRQDVTAFFFIGGDRNDSILFAPNVIIVVVPSTDINDFRTKVVSAFASLHMNEKFDIIESCDGDGQGYELACAYPDIPFVTRCHTPMRIIHHYNKNRSKNESMVTDLKLNILRTVRIFMAKRYSEDVEFKQLSKSNLISCPSQLMITALRTFYPITVDCLTVPYPIDSNPNPLRSDSCATIKIGFVGSLDNRKGLPALTAALNEISGSYDNFCFTFVGRQCLSGPELLSFESLIESRSEKISYAGQMNYSDTREFLQSLDVLVVPSLFDNYPLVCIEAALSGCVVTCSNMVGASKEVSKIDKNLVFKSGTSSSIVKTLVYILNKHAVTNTWISQIRERFVEEFSKCHSLELVGKKHVDVLTTTIIGCERK